jgi:uncharacterized membrane protein YedE/YeeE
VRRALAALASGAVFGFGLALSGVLDPAMVRGFLDFFGDFDPRLGFVFAGAVAVSAAGQLWSRRLLRPAFSRDFPAPARGRIDTPLLLGSALFGLGWGMAGLCPGPAIAGLVLGVPPILVFSAAMLLGMAAHDLARGRRRGGAEDAAVARSA